MIPDSTKYQQVIHKIDQENAQDPNREFHDEKEFPKELIYSYRMTEWLNKMDPDASEELQIAARAQHICRWVIPREEYPMDRKGYHQWRTKLKEFHAAKTASIMKEFGYDEDTIDRVKSLILKKRMKTDPESQMLEDVVCLVFLENYFQDFSQKHEEEKIKEIIQKTWRKMSDMGRTTASQLQLNPEAEKLIREALQEI